MKKITQQRLMALFIVLTFGMSTIAYVMVGEKPKEFKPLDTFVVDYELEEELEFEYLRRGFTILKFYYSEPVFQVDAFPDIFRTNSNQVQLIVEKIQANETYVKITGPYNEEEFNNVTQEKIFDSLCSALYDPPALECGLINITS